MESPGSREAGKEALQGTLTVNEGKSRQLHISPSVRTREGLQPPFHDVIFFTGFRFWRKLEHQWISMRAFLALKTFSFRTGEFLFQMLSLAYMIYFLQADNTRYDLCSTYSSIAEPAISRPFPSDTCQRVLSNSLLARSEDLCASTGLGFRIDSIFYYSQLFVELVNSMASYPKETDSKVSRGCAL